MRHAPTLALRLPRVRNRLTLRVRDCRPWAFRCGWHAVRCRCVGSDSTQKLAASTPSFHEAASYLHWLTFIQ